MSSWPQQKFPTVFVRGVIFGRINVEVECTVSNTHLIKLSVRLSFSFSSLHPCVIFFRCYSSPLFTHSPLAQFEYHASDKIPLRLVLTSENYEALDLFSVSHVIDVRLQKVMAFGARAGIVRPLTLRDRDTFYRSELAARADWVRDGDVKALPPDEHHRRPRWCVKLNGVLQRIHGVELIPSYEEPGVSMAIVVREPNSAKIFMD